MRNFPFNLAGMAQSVIGKQTYYIEKWEGRGEGPQGDDIDIYSDPIKRYASIQPLSATQVAVRGLSMNSYYIEIVDTNTIATLTRTSNPDRLIFDGYYWIPSGPNEDWTLQGEWEALTLVRQGKA